VRHRSSEHALDFDIDEIDPEFLQKVFQLASAPEFLISETTGKVTKIEKWKLVANDYYTINGQDVRNMPRNEISSPGTYAEKSFNLTQF
jgi:hypothetical protein